MGYNYDDRLATQMSFRFPQFTATPLAQLVPSASHDAVVLMQVDTCHSSYICALYIHATNYIIGIHFSFSSMTRPV